MVEESSREDECDLSLESKLAVAAESTSGAATSS